MFERTRSFLHRLTHPSEWGGEERRLWTRRTAQYPVRVHLDEEESLTAQVQDVSRGGVRLLLDREVGHGRTIRIDLPEDQAGMHTSVLACVVHIRNAAEGGYSVGCQFSMELSEPDLQRLGVPRRRAQDHDQRLWERWPAAGFALYRNLRQNGDEKRADIHNISPTGVALRLDEELLPGNLIQLDLHASHDSPTVRIVACVVYLTTHDHGRWLAGCQFIRELDDEDLAALTATDDEATTET